MTSVFVQKSGYAFKDHPKFPNVKLAVLVNKSDTDAVSVSVLDISPGVEIPAHTHDPQVDSIFVVEGSGEGYINGAWQKISAGDYIFVPADVKHGIRNTGNGTLRLFIHHSPPLL